MLFDIVHFWMHITDQVMFGLGKPFDPRCHFVSSFNIASWRAEMRCIHQKQTHQQPKPIQVSANMPISLRPRRFDLDVDRDRLADPGESFRALAEH